ncbi:RNA methyltransferase [Phocaeicola vulgatus]|nr:RNA methyltransferase [Phocaeicola vulgatus]
MSLVGLWMQDMNLLLLCVSVSISLVVLAHIIKRCGDVPVYTGDRELLATLTGYVLTRGVLCAMRRPVLPSMEEICRDTRRIVVIDGVVDTTNIGAIFRSANSWDRCCFVDTQFLRSVESPCGKGVYGFGVLGSMDMVEWYDWRFEQVWFPYCFAMALTDNSISIDHPILAAEPRLAIVMGTEGDGLPYKTIAEADYVVRIPMAHGVDSLNVVSSTCCCLLATPDYRPLKRLIYD